MVQFAPSSEAK